MARRKRHRPPLPITLDRLDARHTSGLDADEKRWSIRGAPVGAVIEGIPNKKQIARRGRLIEAAPDHVTPACPAFGTCGGCQLQEMPLDRQRAEKGLMAARLATADDGSVRLHPTVGAPDAYGYRNKLEFSFGAERFLPEPDPEAPIRGSWLGLHPPGWFSRVVDLEQCPLGTATMNAAITAIRSQHPGPAWDTRAHTGLWRHVVLRDAGTPAAPALLVTLVTTTTTPEEEVRAVADAIAAVPGVRTVLWVVTDRLSDVAIGDLRAVLYGEPHLDFSLRGRQLRIPYDGFFQVNTAGAEVLLDTIDTALGHGPGTLLDLYCGVGAIGLALARPDTRIVGVELHEGAVICARENAARNGLQGEWHAGTVEAVLPTLAPERPARIVVDPPRVGLHPRAARFLADYPDADTLVYVACNPASMGRDRAILATGGWRLTDMWTVDLFPQTHHVEAVGRFVRHRPTPDVSQAKR